MLHNGRNSVKNLYLSGSDFLLCRQNSPLLKLRAQQLEATDLPLTRNAYRSTIAIHMQCNMKGPTSMKKRSNALQRENVRDAKTRWSPGKAGLKALRLLSSEYDLSVARGDLLFLNGGWYITHAGLLRLA